MKQLEYVLADTTMIPNAPTVTEPEYAIESNIDLEFINKFIKAKKAIDTEVFSVDANYDENNTLDIILTTKIKNSNTTYDFFLSGRGTGSFSAKLIGDALIFPSSESKW